MFSNDIANYISNRVHHPERFFLYDSALEEHAEIVQQTLDEMNAYLQHLGLTIRILTEEDITWQTQEKERVANTVNAHTLNWPWIIEQMEQKRQPTQVAFVFCVQNDISSHSGFFAIFYDRESKQLELFAIESFSIIDLEHPLKGKMLKFSLVTLYIYITNLIDHEISEENDGIIINSVVNEIVMAHYTSNTPFKREGGMRSCKMSYAELKDWMQRYGQ